MKRKKGERQLLLVSQLFIILTEGSDHSLKGIKVVGAGKFMIQVRGLKLAFGDQTIFDDVSFIINGNEKIGLVGRNGAGKTTLLKILARTQYPDEGSVTIQPTFKVAYLPQEVVLLSDRSVFTEALNVFNGLGNRLERIKQLEEMLLQTPGVLEVGKELVALQHQLHDEESLVRVQETREVLRGLGFSSEMFGLLVNQLSVGWKMRLVLATLLLSRADFYLFDEPTNHLDLPAQDWFFDFLIRSKSGFLLVSHNRYFLDRACATIFELSLGALTVYRGNYTIYLEQKAQRQAALEKQYAEQQKFIQKQTAVIERFRASASKASTVQSMIKGLEKIEPIKLEPVPRSVIFHFPPVPSAGKEVLMVQNVAMSFGTKPLFDKVSFIIKRGHKVALVAPNGTGKSTLLSLVMGKLAPSKGTVIFGHKVKPVIFEQDQNISLDSAKTVLDTALDSCKTSEERQRVRAFLGAFLFSGDEVQKKVEVLSGGEKNRLAMVRVLLQNGNLLLLDEPTNHLDMQAKEVLLSALQQYQGTILFVSHDRDFLNRLATDIIELTPQGAFCYQGTYDEFLYAKSRLTSVATPPQEKNIQGGSQTPVKKRGEELYQLHKRIRAVEGAIDRLEREKSALLERFERLLYGTAEYDQACQLLKELEQKLEKQELLWESLIEQEGISQ